MITTFQDFTSDDAEPRSRNRLTTRSLRDDEIRAIADANYRGDNPLRFVCVRQAALMFERAGYSISLSPEVSPLAVPPQPIAVGDLVVDVMHRTVRFGSRELDLKPREFGLLEILARHPGQVFSRAHLLDCVWPRDYDRRRPYRSPPAPSRCAAHPNRSRRRLQVGRPLCKPRRLKNGTCHRAMLRRSMTGAAAFFTS